MEEAMDAAQPTADVFPDNVEAVDIFTRCMNQWRIGFGGPYALDYNVLPIVAPVEFKSPEWGEIFASLKVMESAALETIAEQQRKKGKR
jgi:hypothetical protein